MPDPTNMDLTEDVEEFTAKDGTVFTADGASIMVYLDDAVCQLDEEGRTDNPVYDALQTLLDNAGFLGKYLPGKQNGHSG